MLKSHINKAYDQELRSLKDKILQIANRVDRMLFQSITALCEQNSDLAQEIIEYDKYIDKTEIAIDRQCLEMLARRQPLAEDLRFIVATLKMVTYFERIGDLSAKICYRLLEIKKLKIKSQTKELEEMAKQVHSMIKMTTEALLLQDTKKAALVIKQDSHIDNLYHSTIKNYIKQIISSPENTELNLHLLSIAKWIERMGDHCTNLAELIIFMIKGEDIRHQSKEPQKSLNLL